MGNSLMDVQFNYTKKVAADFSRAVEKYGKPYIRRATTEFLEAGVPSDALDYAFYVLFANSRMWHLPKKYEEALSAMNRVIASNFLTPDYDQHSSGGPEYIVLINKALSELADWMRFSVSSDLQRTYDQITLKYATQAAKENNTYTVDEWRAEFENSILTTPSFYPDGNQASSMIHALFR